MVSPHEVARETAENGLTRMVKTLAVVLPSLALLQVLVNSGDYRQPVAASLVWLAVLGTGAWYARRSRTGTLTARQTTGAIALAVAAVTATGAVHQSQVNPGRVDLAVLGTAWIFILIAMSHSARVWVPAALLVLTAQDALVIREHGLNLVTLSQLAAGGYIIATILVAFTALRSALDLHADLAARQASLASRSAAERAAAAAIRQERRSRLAMLEQEALPLLRGIADGTLDSDDDQVREQCARHAAALRQALAESARSGEFAVGLDQVLRASAARGLPVTVQLIGDPGTAPPPVARAIVATVAAVLSALPPHQVVLTVLGGDDDDVELYLTFDAPLRAVPDLARFGGVVPAGARWRAIVHTAETGGGFLEVSWQEDGAV